MKKTYRYAPHKKAVLTMDGINCTEIKFPRPSDYPSWLSASVWEFSADAYRAHLNEHYASLKRFGCNRNVDSVPDDVLERHFWDVTLEYLEEDADDYEDDPDYDPLLLSLLVTVAQKKIDALIARRVPTLWQWRQQNGLLDEIDRRLAAKLAEAMA